MSIWQVAIFITVLLETTYNLATKFISDKADRDKPLLIFAGRYLVLVIVGALFSLAMLNWQIPAPNFSWQVWLLLLVEGIVIPISSILAYTITQKVGAGSAVMISTLFTMIAASLGAIILSEPTPVTFLLGSLFIVGGVFLVFLSEHKLAKCRPLRHCHPRIVNSMFLDKVVYGRYGLLYAVLLSCLLFPIGAITEKVALDQVGIWTYCIYGWGFQLVGTLILLSIFGRSELKDKGESIKSFRLGIVLGLFLALAAIPYIYTMSIGKFSGTSVALTGRIAMTFLFSAIIFKEYKNVTIRALSCVMSLLGIILIIS